MIYKKGVVAAMMLAAVCANVYGQEDAPHARNESWKRGADEHGTGAKTTVGSTEEDKYDVKYVRLNLEMTNVATTLGGDVITTAQVVATTMGAYVFEMKAPLVLDSVHIDGVLRPATSVGDVYTVPFTAPMAVGTMFTAQVYYHGTPVSGTPSNIYGISALTSSSWGNRVTFTLSEPYSAKDWWPCKQSLTDKIDSSDVWITVADSLKAGSNGILEAVTPMGGSRNRYQWKSRYPIDYYLISASVAKYVDYSYYMHFAGSADSMLIQNYIYDNPLTLPAFKNVIDSTGILINYFSSIWGRYPFWKEKYGHCMAPLSGGEEHQTMTTLGFFQSWLVVHELAHQWFGNNVTCATWGDITMNEGFASYSEYLYLDRFRTHAHAIADIVDRQENVMRELDGSVYVYDTTNEGRIFSSRFTYDKGACVIHTFRHVLDNDTYFFDILKGWQTSRADGTGTIMDFKNLAQSMVGTTVNGINLDTFFNQWFYKEGYPAYAVKWNRSGGEVFVQVDQATSAPASVSLFKVPLELKLKSATGDTLIRIVNDAPSQSFHFTWTKAMNGIEVDPNNWLIDSMTSVIRDFTLGIPGYIQESISIYPNPGTTKWVAQGIPANSELQLTDITGKELWQASNSGNTTIDVPAQKLAPGLYLLRISNNGAQKVFKVVKE